MNIDEYNKEKEEGKDPDDITHEYRSSGTSGSGSDSGSSKAVTANTTAIGVNSGKITSNTAVISKHTTQITVILENQRRELEPMSDYVTVLMTEYSKGLDQDFNGLVFGYNFIFDKETNKRLPMSMRSMNNKFYDEKSKTEEWKSIQPGGRMAGRIRKISFKEFAESIPSKPDGHYLDVTKRTAYEFGRMAGFIVDEQTAPVVSSDEPDVDEEVDSVDLDKEK